jgi:DNA-binding NarL/FixJ family response regulator
LIESQHPDLVIVDISLKRGSGIDLIKEIVSRFPEVKTIVSSMHDEFLYAERSLRAGALGYVNKQEAAGVIIEAIQEVLSGKTYLSGAMQTHLLTAVSGRSRELSKPGVASLSDRELEVMSMIGQGLATREIAERLELSIHTIETYREKIKVKLNLKNAAELWRFAVEWVLEAKS